MLAVGKAKGLIRKKKTLNLIKEKKAKPADSQPTTLAKTTAQLSGRNLQRTKRNCCNQQLGQEAVSTPASSINLVNSIPNNFGDAQNRPIKEISQIMY